jgi:hypothetical protein
MGSAALPHEPLVNLVVGTIGVIHGISARPEGSWEVGCDVSTMPTLLPLQVCWALLVMRWRAPAPVAVLLHRLWTRPWWLLLTTLLPLRSSHRRAGRRQLRLPPLILPTCV